MYIKWAKITNFRGIQGGFFPFKPGLNILIGPSNIGKSTVLAAVDLVLNPNCTWWHRDALSELDFHKKNITKPITIKLMLGCGPYKCMISSDGNKQGCLLNRSIEEHRLLPVGKCTSTSTITTRGVRC